MLTSFLVDEYQPWELLLEPRRTLKGQKLKAFFESFLSSVPERMNWWQEVCERAEIPFAPGSLEAAIVGWRLIKDGYAEEIHLGGSGGTWICLAWDWGIHTSEVLRKKHNLNWSMPKPSMLDAGHPYLVGVPGVHKDYGYTVLYQAMENFNNPDYVPPMPIAIFEEAERRSGHLVDFWGLCELGLPEKKLSYHAGIPPDELTLCKADLIRHPKRETWAKWFRTGTLAE
jgi:hypothetical protein